MECLGWREFWAAKNRIHNHQAVVHQHQTKNQYPGERSHGFSIMATTGSEAQDLSSMSDIVVPSTPPPQPTHTSNSTEMTPPPSTQPPRTTFMSTQSKSTQRSLFLQSPPSTVKAGIDRAVPISENIAKADQEELRRIVQDLLLAVAEARMSAAHFKLQHSLLTIECQESALRAEIENQMTHREVEVLQAAEHRRSATAAVPQISQSPAQSEIDVLLRTCKDLEEGKNEAEHKLQKAKRIIEQEIDKTELLHDENMLLKTRIRENREHFNMMRRSPAFHTLAIPSNDFATPQRKSAPQFTEPTRSHVSSRNQDPFAALLAADQVLSGEAASLPSTPTKTQSFKFHHGHARGAYSLSSLHTTPTHARSVIAGRPNYENEAGSGNRITYSAPSTKLVGLSDERDCRDRDSTISVSDQEALTDEDLPQSQASSLAANMLRRNPGSQGSSSFPGQAERSSKVLQTKLFGQVKKAGTDRKRRSSFGDSGGMKKSKLAAGVVGLGIGAWRVPEAR